MDSTWNCDEGTLNSVLELLQNSLVPDNEIQKQVQEKLAFIQSHPMFINYFLYVMEKPQLFDDNIRALSGLILKNNLLQVIHVNVELAVPDLLTRCLQLMMDSSKEVRSSVAAIITVLALKGGLEKYPHLFDHLAMLMDNTQEEIQMSAVTTMACICEDFLAEHHVTLNESIKKMLHKFLILTRHSSVPIRQNAFKILNEVLQNYYGLVKDDLCKEYLAQLIASANDDNEEVILSVCQGFICYISNQDANVLPYLGHLIEYMLVKTKNPYEEIALQACEFWFSVSKLSNCQDILRGHLSQLVPVLLHNMRYSEAELHALKDTLGKDTDKRDNPQDVKPFGRALEEDDDPEIGWTLRKCSAASIDSLAVSFGSEIIKYVIPLVLEMCVSNDVLVKESGILALGAIADGCLEGLAYILPDLIPQLVACMDNDHSLIRSITCWTLSRYVRFIVTNDQFFVDVLFTMLKHSLDDNKRVQRAAISSFCYFQEEAKGKLVAHMKIIVETFLRGFEVYQVRSLYLLYDAIGSFATAIGKEFALGFHMLVPRIVERFVNWSESYPADEYLALCECFAMIIHSVDVHFAPYVEVVFNKCCNVLQDFYGHAKGDGDGYEKDLAAASFDLLVTLSTGVNKCFIECFSKNATIVDHLFYAIQDEALMMRQAGLALLGEVVPFVKGQLPSFLPAIIENLDKRFNGACNNAAWVVGKLCLTLNEEMSPYAVPIVEHSLEILQATDGLQTMYKTVAISLCTLGLVCPNVVSQYLKPMMRPVCSTIRNVGDCDGKLVAFKGLCLLVLRQPEVLNEDLAFFCDALASWNSVNDELRQTVQFILMEYRKYVGEEAWAKMYGQFRPVLRNRMENLYAV